MKYHHTRFWIHMRIDGSNNSLFYFSELIQFFENQKKASPPESSEYRHRHLTSNLESALYRVHELKACIEPYPHRLSLAMSSSCCRR